ncbi:hypothetical protein KKB41_00200 [Patescibacteria group bacterium]|nr:hypothetical protein [Patescibacteria group bacterium]
METLPVPKQLAITYDKNTPTYKAYKSNNDISGMLGMCSAVLMSTGYFMLALILTDSGVLAALGMLPAGILTAFGLYKLSEAIRKRKVRKILSDPRNRYLYSLIKSIDEYNEEAESFDKYFSKGLGGAKEEEIQEAQRRLLKVREELQARVLQVAGSSSSPEVKLWLPRLSSVEQKVTSLKEAEIGFLTSPQHKALLPASEHMREALAELDEEFPTD